MKARDGGFVLVSVLWVVALLTVITLSYHHRARLEVQAARYGLDSTQAMMAARGAVQRGMLDLRNKAVMDALVVAPDQPDAPLTYLGQPWARGGDLFGAGALLDPGEGFDDDQVTYVIEDLERYININNAPEEVLASVPGISRPVARRIQFQRGGTDEAGAPSEGGAVAFHDIAELRYVRGVDDKDWFGSRAQPGLREVLTTVGDGRVNVNTASYAVLSVLPDVGEQAAKDILAWRNGDDGLSGSSDDRGCADWAVLSSEVGISGDTLIALKQLCKFDSSFFKITGVATRRGGRIRSSCAAVVRISGDANDATLISWTEESLGAQ